MVKKNFKLTYKQEGSGSQSVVMDVTPKLTFGWLTQLAETEFGISENKQKFKMGFPPKILKMEPNEPLMLSSGDSIMVENIEPSPSLSSLTHITRAPSVQSKHSPTCPRLQET